MPVNDALSKDGERFPHVVAQMGTALRHEVERQLLADLEHYCRGIGVGPSIDWSDPCQEGHCTNVLGGTLEDMSDVAVRNREGATIADGWIDFVHGGDNLPLFVFWLFLDVIEDGVRKRVKDDVFIPEHVWHRLPDESKDACGAEGRYDSRWTNDPKVIAWRLAR